MWVRACVRGVRAWRTCVAYVRGVRAWRTCVAYVRGVRAWRTCVAYVRGVRACRSIRACVHVRSFVRSCVRAGPHALHAHMYVRAVGVGIVCASTLFKVLILFQL